MTHRVCSTGRHREFLHLIPYGLLHDPAIHIVEWKAGQYNDTDRRGTTKRRRTRNRTRMTCRSFMEPAVMPMECAHHGGEILMTNQRPPSTGFCARTMRATWLHRLSTWHCCASHHATQLHGMIAWRHDQLTALVRFPTPLPRPAARLLLLLLVLSLDFHFSMNPFQMLRNWRVTNATCPHTENSHRRLFRCDDDLVFVEILKTEDARTI